MPIYEYRCASCSHETEALQKFSDPPLTTCPKCKAETMVKLISAAGFQLKGTGWYATDFKGTSRSAPKTDGPGNGKAEDASGKSAAEPSSDKSTSETSATKSTSDAAPASGTSSGTASTCS